MYGLSLPFNCLCEVWSEIQLSSVYLKNFKYIFFLPIKNIFNFVLGKKENFYYYYFPTNIYYAECDRGKYFYLFLCVKFLLLIIHKEYY